MDIWYATKRDMDNWALEQKNIWTFGNTKAEIDGGKGMEKCTQHEEQGLEV